MKRKYFSILSAASLSALIFAACADSGDYGEGNAPAPETGTESGAGTSITNADPGVAAESGTYQEPANQSPERQFNSLGSASAPSANVPASVATNGTESPRQNATEGGESPSLDNVQGSQRSPEPATGDDANPDQVNPER